MRPLISRLCLTCLLAVAGRISAIAADAPAETAADVASRALLDALEDREMPDMAIRVLDRIEADPEASDELKREAAFRRAAALIGISRTEADSKKRAAFLDDAQAALDAFLKSGTPTARQAISAYTQKGSLLVERGRTKAEQATRPGADSTALRAEAVAFFDAAIASLEGKTKPGEEIADVTNAEDAVLKVLREVDERIAALKPSPKKEEGENQATAGGEKTSGSRRAVKPVRLTSKERRELTTLEEQQESLRGKLLQTRLTAAAAVFEKAKAFPDNAKERTETLTKSAAMFKAIADKYPTVGAGLFARYYEGRNYALLGQWEKAVATLAPLVVLDQKVPLAIRLRTLAVNTTLESLLGEIATIKGLPEAQLNERYQKVLPGATASTAAEKVAALTARQFMRFDAATRAFAMEDVRRLPGASLDADWLGLKYRAAELLDFQADSINPKDQKLKAEQTKLQADARKLAVEVARANADFAEQARKLAAKLGRNVAEGEKTFADVMQEAKNSLGIMQGKAAEANAAKAAKDAVREAAARQEVAAARDAAVAKLQEALGIAGLAEPLSAGSTDEPKLAEDVSIDDVNQARYYLTFLLYEGGRFSESAGLGRMLAERYPNAKGSRQAAKIAMAAWQQAAQKGEGQARDEARAQAAELAAIVMKTWPDEAESADAAVIAIAAAAAAKDPAAIASIIPQVPPTSPRQPEVLLRAGIALWREVQEARRQEQGVRPDEATIDSWKATATKALDDGLASLADTQALPGPPMGPLAVAGALSRVQISMETGDDRRAAELLEHPIYGPWTLVAGDNPAVNQGSLAEPTLTLALRLFIQTEDFAKAERAMAGLEKAAGQGDEASAKLTAMYLSMGRDLQAQLESLGSGEQAASPAIRARAERILTGFEKFLDGVAARDPKPSSQIWVATTYLTLGSGKGTGAIVPAAKKAAYLKKSADVYQKLLASKDDPEAGRFEPSIRLRMASIYQELGDWPNAQQQIDWILSDSKRQNSLEAQISAAQILQAAGMAAAAAGDNDAANNLLREAAGGRKGTPAVIWGWGNIANKLARQGITGGDEKAQQARENFFDARLRVVECLLARARLPGGVKQDRDKRLATAEVAIAMTRKLYPDLGGEAFAKRYERVLKDVQRERGQEPTGFTALDEQARAAGTRGSAGGTP